MASVCFLVPCFNEQGNVVESIEGIRKAVAGRAIRYEILVIDDASTDTTADCVRAYQQAHGSLPLRMHRNERNRGLGYNYFLGATLTDADYYMLVSGDRAQPAEAIEAVLDRLGQADVVIPYMHDQSSRGWVRRALSRAFTELVNLFSGQRLRYYNGPVLHHRSTVLKWGWGATGFGYQAELLCLALSEPSSFIEVPIPLVARMKGRTSAFRWNNMVSVSGSLMRIAGRRIRGSRACAQRISPAIHDNSSPLVSASQPTL